MNARGEASLGVTLHGVRYGIVMDPAVRARDLDQHTLTVQRESDGEVITVHAVEVQAAGARPERLPQPRRRWKLRALAERIASFPDDPRWTEQLMNFASHHQLLESPDHDAISGA